MDFLKVLGSVVNQGMTPSANRRIENSTSQPGGLEVSDLLNSLGGSGSGQFGEILGNLGEMGRAAMRSGDDGKTNPMVTGGLGALAGALLGGGSSSMKGALGGTALAVLGSLAVKALSANRSSMQDQEQVMAGLRPPRNEEEVEQVQQTAQLTIRAMLNAAKADGHGDRDEIRRIIGEASEDGLTREEQAFISAEIHKPMETEEIVRAVPNQQVAAQVYAASLLAIEVDTDVERRYLHDLASSLRLDRSVVENLHTALGVS